MYDQWCVSNRKSSRRTYPETVCCCHGMDCLWCPSLSMGHMRFLAIRLNLYLLVFEIEDTNSFEKLF